MAEVEDTPVMVTVMAAKWHTYNGQAYEKGTMYEVDERLVDTLQTQAMAFKVDNPPPPEPLP